MQELGSSRDVVVSVCIFFPMAVCCLVWHYANTLDSRIKLYSVNKSKPATAKRLKQLEEHGAGLLPITRPVPFDLESEEEYLEQMAKRGGRDPEE
jgi:hypothetical protein